MLCKSQEKNWKKRRKICFFSKIDTKLFIKQKITSFFYDWQVTGLKRYKENRLFIEINNLQLFFINLFHGNRKDIAGTGLSNSLEKSVFQDEVKADDSMFTSFSITYLLFSSKHIAKRIKTKCLTFFNTKNMTFKTVTGKKL